RHADVAGDALRGFDSRRVAGRHVAADALAADRAAHAGHLDVPRYRLGFDRRAAWHGDGVVHRDGVVVVAGEAVAVVFGADVDAARPIVDGDPHLGELALIAARSLDRVDRHFVARPAGDHDAARDV